MAFTTKIKIKHFITQVAAAVNALDDADPKAAQELTLAWDAWSGHYDEDDEQEVVNLGNLVAEFVTHTIDHYEERISDLQEEKDELEDKLEQIKELAGE